MAIATLLTTVGSLVLSGIGLYKQNQEDEKAKIAYGKATKEEQKRYDTQLGITLSEIRKQEEESKRRWKWEEESRDYTRAQGFVSNFKGMLDRQPQFANNLTSIWRRG